MTLTLSSYTLNQDNVIEFYQNLRHSDYPVLEIKFENLFLDVVTTLHALNEEAEQLRKNVTREQTEREQQVSSVLLLGSGPNLDG